MNNQRSVSVWVGAILMAVTSSLSAQELYRYQDEDGVTILNSVIPAEYLNSGYEVLDSRGIVIEVVPPVPEEELNPELVIDKEDALLVTSYSSVVDIEDRRDRVLHDIRMEIDNIESDNRVLREQLAEAIGDRDQLLRTEKQQGLREWQAARLVELEVDVKDMSETAIKLQTQLQERSKELVLVQNDFALKIERFMQLKQSEVDVRAAYNGGERSTAE